MKIGDRTFYKPDDYELILKVDLQKLEARVKKLTEALEFYANGHWNGDVSKAKNDPNYLTNEVALKALEEK